MDWFLIITSLIKIIVVVLLTILPMVAYSVYAERRVSALIQDRLGPNRVGWQGLLQPIADGLKFLIKEDVTPGHVNKFYFWLAPALVPMRSCNQAGNCISDPNGKTAQVTSAGTSTRAGASQK